MTNHDRDIFSQVISTGSRDQEIEVSLSSFSSLHNDALESVVEVKVENSTDFPDYENGLERHALSSSFDSIEEKKDTREPLIDSSDEPASDLDCILAEAEGELMALLGSSVTKSGDSEDSLANLDVLCIEESSEKETAVEKEPCKATELIDLPALLALHDEEAITTFDESAVAFYHQQSGDETELETLETKDDFNGIQLANVIEEDSVETGELASIEFDREQKMNGDCCLGEIAPEHGDEDMTGDVTLVTNADIQSPISTEQNSLSASCELFQVSDRPVFQVRQDTEMIESELSVSMSLSQQLDGALDTYPVNTTAPVELANPFYQQDTFCNNATSKSDQSNGDADYDEEKKWDVNSISYPSADRSVCDNDGNFLMHSQAQCDLIEETECDTLEQIVFQPESNIVAASVELLSSRESQTTGFLTANEALLLQDDSSSHTERQANSQTTAEPSSRECNVDIDLPSIPSDDSNDGAATCKAPAGTREDLLDAPQIETESHEGAADAENFEVAPRILIDDSIDENATISNAEPDVPRLANQASTEGEYTLRLPINSSNHDCSATCDEAAASHGEVLEVPRIEKERSAVIEEAGSGDETLRIPVELSNDCSATCDAVGSGHEELLEVLPIENNSQEVIAGATGGCDDSSQIANDEFNGGAAASITVTGRREEVMDAPRNGEDTPRIANEESNDDCSASCDAVQSAQEELPEVPRIEKEKSDVIEEAGNGEETLRIANEESSDDCSAICETVQSVREDSQIENETPKVITEAGSGEEWLRIAKDESTDDCSVPCDAVQSAREELPEVPQIESETPEGITEAGSEEEALRITNEESNDGCSATCDAVQSVCEELPEVPLIDNKTPKVITEAGSEEERLRIAKDESTDETLRIASSNGDVADREEIMDVSQIEDDNGENPLRVPHEYSNDDCSAICDTVQSVREELQEVPLTENKTPEVIAEAGSGEKTLRVANGISNDEGCDAVQSFRKELREMPHIDKETPEVNEEAGSGEETLRIANEESNVETPRIANEEWNDDVAAACYTGNREELMDVPQIENGSYEVIEAGDGEKTLRNPNEDETASIFAGEGLLERRTTSAEYRGEGASCDHQKASESSRPPLFPNKRLDLHENPDELLNFLSTKLKSQKLPQESTVPLPLTRTADKLFDPDRSVFTRMEDDSFGTLDISPPGSPIGLYFERGDDESSSDESCSVSSRVALFSLAHPEIAPWDMIPSAFPSSQNASTHPELIVTGDLADDSEALLPDLRQGHENWTGTSVPDGESVGVKENLGSVEFTVTAPSERITLGHVAVDKPLQISSKTPLLSLCKSAEEPIQRINSEDFASVGARRPRDNSRNASRKHSSKFRRTMSLPNLQSLEKDDRASHFSSGVNDQENASLQFPRESFTSGDKEVTRGIQFARSIDAVLPNPSGICEEPKRFPNVKGLFPSLQDNCNECIKYMASLQWMQLQASWLHKEVARSSFLNQQLRGAATFSNSDLRSYSAGIATANCMTVNSRIRDLQLCRISKHDNLSGSRTTTNDLLRLSAYLSWDQRLNRSHLKHNIPLEKGNEVESLLSAASSRLRAFSSIVREIGVLGDATMNAEEADFGFRHSIGIKRAHALQLKAKQKYGGDILQVKDVLRGRIVFPDEGALLCGLFRLMQITNAQIQNTGSRGSEARLCIVRIKNLFQESSPGRGLARSGLPTGYRHVLVNVEIDDEFIAEIQLNLSAFYDVLGDKGPILHRDLSNLQAAVISRSSELPFLDTCTLLECASGITTPHEVPRGEREAVVSVSLEELGTEKTSSDQHTSVDSTGTKGTLRWTDIPDKLKDDFLNDLTMNTTIVSEEDLSIALLECATVLASEKPEDPACCFCLCLVILYCLRSCPAKQVSSICNVIGKFATLLGFAQSCLINCLSICSQLDHGDKSGFGISVHVLTLLASMYAEDERWNDAASVLETLILACEENCTGASPIIITALLDVASMSRRAGNHSHASRLISQANERVSMLLVETEAYYMEYLRNASKNATKDAPLFYLDNGRDSFEILRQFIIVFQEMNEQSGVQKFRDPWIWSIYRRILGDSVAVLANCEQATWIYLPTNSTDEAHNMEPTRSYWSLALSHFEKAFTGFSAVAGLENRDVSGAMFGMARCLRELGETDKALELLSMVVTGLENVAPVAQDPALGHVRTPSSASYLSHVMSKQGLNKHHTQVHHHIMRSLCLWWMSILSVDKSKDEDGRTRAFRFLHTSSVSLQLALTEMHDRDEKTRKVCVDFLEKIEREAKHLSQQR